MPLLHPLPTAWALCRAPRPRRVPRKLVPRAAREGSFRAAPTVITNLPSAAAAAAAAAATGDSLRFFAQLRCQTAIYLGVEWDDSGRGKHDGSAVSLAVSEGFGGGGRGFGGKLPRRREHAQRRRSKINFESHDLPWGLRCLPIPCSTRLGPAPPASLFKKVTPVNSRRPFFFLLLR